MLFRSDRDIKNRARESSHVFPLPEWVLVMQTTQDATRRTRVIVLHKSCRKARFGKIPSVKAFHKETPGIIKYPRLNDQHAWKRCFAN